MKKLNKKGFTLAELLIVVAIIAVLVAIAVPLFVGALNNAEKGVKDANIRAVRGLAIASIMSDTKYDLDVDGTTWYASATVDNKGTVKDLTIYTVSTAATKKVPADYTTDKAKDTSIGDATDFCIKNTNGTYKVWVQITEEDKVEAAPGKIE